MIEFEKLFSFRQRGIGYTHPRFPHGGNHGELEVAGESIRLEDFVLTDPSSIPIQTLCRGRMGDQDGLGGPGGSATILALTWSAPTAGPDRSTEVLMDEVTQAYRTKATELAELLGTVVSPQDPGRGVVEPWAETISGRILDVGAGTGRWTGHLAALGHDVEGLEPVDRFVELARRTHPAAPFRHASIADLVGTGERWAGILAWYSLIHLRPDELPTALSTLREVVEDNGSLLVSFFSGPRVEAFEHPAATAYRWPMTAMVQALEGAGFEVTDEQWQPQHQHASVTAKAS